MAIPGAFRLINICTSIFWGVVGTLLVTIFTLHAGPLAGKEVHMSSAMEVHWAPPALKPGYTVLDLSKTGNQNWFKFGADEDVLIIAPPGTYTLERLEVSGGHNIILSGGEFIPSGGTQTATLKFTNIHGEVWVEGVHIDNRNVGERDAIAAFAADGSEATFTLQNSFIDNVHGSYNGVHGDVFQPHGDLQHIRMYNVVGRSNFQGLFLDPQREIDSVDLINVQMQYLPGGDDITFLYNFWMNSGPPYPITMENVWVDQKEGQNALQHSVFPPQSWGTTRTGDIITWPNMPFEGGIHVGTPPGGYFVRPDQVGLSYGRSVEELRALWEAAQQNGTPAQPPLPVEPAASEHSHTQLNGTDGNDVMIGTAGNDLLNGRGGDDRMEGGAGDDTYIVNRLRDTPVEVAGGGIDTVQVSLEGYRLPDHVENLITTNHSGVLLMGNELANRIQGGRGDDLLNGGKGDDLLVGGEGNDTFLIRNGGGWDIIQDLTVGDVLRLEGYSFTDRAQVMMLARASGNDVAIDLGSGDGVLLHGIGLSDLAGMDIRVVSSAATSTTPGGAVDVPESHASAQWLKGTAGDDTIRGTDGNDYINGNDGNDLCIGGRGDDRYNVGGMQDTVIEVAGQGIDTVINWGRYYRLPDHVENLELMRADGAVGIGNDLGNRLLGSASDDIIDGMGGDDLLIGGGGRDILIGGAGRDVFRATAMADGGDTIEDFHTGEDRLDLRPIVAERSGGDLGQFLSLLRISMDASGISVAVLSPNAAADPISLFHLDGAHWIDVGTDLILTDAMV